MILIITVFLIIGIVSVAIGIITYRSEKYFNANHKTSCGILTGYYIREDTKWDIPMLALDIEGVVKKYKCKSKGMNRSTCKPGTELNIKYIEKNLLNIKYYDIRIDECNFTPYSKFGASYILIILGIVMMLSALAMALN